MDNKKTVVVFKAFGDENRLQILNLLRNGEKCACKLLEEMQITQPTLSHHMKILCDADIVIGRKEGKWMHYSISAEGMNSVKKCLDSFTEESGQETKKSCCKNS